MTRPAPVPDATSEGFWSRAAAGELALARCARCSTISHPPAVVCPTCGSADPSFTFDVVAGTGEVRSWTVVRRSFLPGFDVPFVLVDVKLDGTEDVRLIGRLTDDDTELSVGDHVALDFEVLDDGSRILAFRLAQHR